MTTQYNMITYHNTYKLLCKNQRLRENKNWSRLLRYFRSPTQSMNSNWPIFLQHTITVVYYYTESYPIKPIGPVSKHLWCQSHYHHTRKKILPKMREMKGPNQKNVNASFKNKIKCTFLCSKIWLTENRHTLVNFVYLL